MHPTATTDAPARHTDTPLVVYDGECGMCDSFIRRLVDADRGRRLRFASSHSTLGAALASAAGHANTVGSSILLVADGTTHTESDAILRAIAIATGSRWPHLVTLAVPRWIRDPLYRLIAQHRHHVPGFAPSCRLMSPDERAVFVDLETNRDRTSVRLDPRSQP